MRVDEIQEIIKKYEELPYECIMIDGPWGVGKSYAISKALEEKKKTCVVSLFGLKDAQEIYHEVLVGLMMKDGKSLKTFFSKVLDIISLFSKKVEVTSKILKSLVREKELFLNLSRKFDTYHFIVIDDLERISKDVNWEEVLGIVEELKKCNYVKVILVANKNELPNSDSFEKMSEKVIDRIYRVTKIPEKVNWAELKIHDAFINDFLKEYPVKNLRTLQKAQQLYDDVKLKLKEEYKDEFFDEIRLVCFAIVVESVEKIFYKQDSEQLTTTQKATRDIYNKLNIRVQQNYTNGLRVSRNMVDVICGYYENEMQILDDVMDAEYQIFMQAGKKSNFYKSDDELKMVMPELKEKILKEKNVAKLMKYADEYFIWNKYVQLDSEQLEKEYKTILQNLIYEEALNGKIEYLLDGSVTFHLDSPINTEIFRAVRASVKTMLVDEYVKYLSSNTYSEKAYKYSEQLKGFINNIYLRDAVLGKVDALYNENSFPINNVTELQYRVSRNIMYVLHYENDQRFLKYCDEIKENCDNMARHRIEILVEQILKK